MGVMPRKRRKELPALELGDELIGQRLARLRKQRGFTQSELANNVGITQPLLSDYERARLQISAEMAVRFALALKVSCDELVGLKGTDGHDGSLPPRRLMKRVELIQQLSQTDQRTLLRTIDAFLRGVETAAQ